MSEGTQISQDIRSVQCLTRREHTSKLLRGRTPSSVLEKHSCFYCVFLFPSKVAELEQQLADCEDGLDHYQNIASLK